MLKSAPVSCDDLAGRFLTAGRVCNIAAKLRLPGHLAIPAGATAKGKEATRARVGRSLRAGSLHFKKVESLQISPREAPHARVGARSYLRAPKVPARSPRHRHRPAPALLGPCARLAPRRRDLARLRAAPILLWLPAQPAQHTSPPAWPPVWLPAATSPYALHAWLSPARTRNAEPGARAPRTCAPAPCTLCPAPAASVALTPLGCWSQVNKQGEEMGHKCKVRSPRPSHAGTLPTPHQVCE